MVDNTDNHGLNKYSEGEDNWTHSTDMDHIEERLVVRDTETNRTNYTPHDGAVFISTDTGVVYDGNGSSWNKASRGLDSVAADDISSSEYYLDGSKTVTDLNNLIDTITTENSGNGGVIHCEPNSTYTVTDTTGVVLIKSDVEVNFHWSTVRLADNLDDNAPSNGLVQFDNESKTTNATVRNVEADGNIQNNTFSERHRRGGVRLSDNRHDGTNFIQGEVPEKCTVENVYAHDTIASNAFLAADDCTMRNLWLENSGNDHWLYLNRPVDCHVENVWCTGFARQEGITFGNFVDRPFNGTTLEGVTIKGVSHTPVMGSDLENIVHVRDADAGAGVRRDNTLRDFTIEVSDSSSESYFVVEGPTTVENITWRGQSNSDGSGIIQAIGAAEGSSFNNIVVDLEGTDRTSVYPAIQQQSSNITWRDVTIIENQAQAVRGFFIQPSGIADERSEITGYNIDVGSAAFRFSEANQPINRMSIHDGYASGGAGVWDADSGVTYESGTNAPQNVLNILNPHDGYRAFHDGTDGGNTNAKEPAFYHGGAAEWRGVYSNSTIA